MKYVSRWTSTPPVSALALPLECVLDEPSRLNAKLAWGLTRDPIRKPTIRPVRSGTFSDFHQPKLDEGSNNVDEGSNSLGQIKVPVVLAQTAYVTWFSNRVLQELSLPS